jgi:hypothetical protein
METIQEIKEVSYDYNDTFPRSRSNMNGYAIVTNKQVIGLLIDSNQCCCENWGYFTSEDDFSTFIGAELVDISLSDTALNEAKLKEQYCIDPHDKWFEGGLMFVDFKTNMGVLQFVVYNIHNGCYGHSACVVSQQLKHEEIL